MLDQGRRAVGIEESDPPGHPPDDPAGPLLTPGQEIEQASEEAEQDHADPGGHDDQDGRRLRLSAVVAGGGMEPVGDQERHQRAPKHDVEDHCGTDPLGTEGESGVGAADPGLGQQAVPEGRSWGRPPRGDMGEGQRRHVDAEQAEPARPIGREHGVGELGVRRQGTDLQQDAEGQVAEVDVGQRVDFGPVAGQQGQGDVEDEQEHQHGAHAQPDLPADERAPVPPTAMGWRRHIVMVGRHHLHVGTTDPLGPDMLAVWQTRPRTTPRAPPAPPCWIQSTHRP